MSEFSSWSNDQLIEKIKSSGSYIPVCDNPDCVYCGAENELRNRLAKLPAPAFQGVKFEYLGEVTVDVNGPGDRAIRLEDDDDLDNWFYASLPYPERIEKKTANFKITVESVG